MVRALSLPRTDRLADRPSTPPRAQGQVLCAKSEDDADGSVGFLDPSELDALCAAFDATGDARVLALSALATPLNDARLLTVARHFRSARAFVLSRVKAVSASDV